MPDLINIKDLTVAVTENRQEKTIVDHVSLTIPELSIVGLVGGSGSGKTTTGMAILGLLALGLTVQEGEIIFQGRDLLKAPEEEMRKIRGNDIAMIFQEPLYAFNPVFSIGYQIDEVLQTHTRLDAKQREVRIYELLDMAGLSEPRRLAANFPHQLSGGMRQRAMIAQAIAADPKLIIADEPTSNLDVTLQATIIELFKKLRDELSLSILLITHDLGMIEHAADRVAVMSGGKIVEQGDAGQIVQNPQAEYTKQLMRALRI